MEISVSKEKGILLELGEYKGFRLYADSCAVLAENWEIRQRFCELLTKFDEMPLKNFIIEVNCMTEKVKEYVDKFLDKYKFFIAGTYMDKRYLPYCLCYETLEEAEEEYEECVRLAGSEYESCKFMDTDEDGHLFIRKSFFDNGEVRKYYSAENKGVEE